jgi:hypothetical protein
MRSAEERERVLSLYGKGVAMKEIERRTGIPYFTVYRWCKPDRARVRAASSRAWKETNRETNRARDRAYWRREDVRGTCLHCGGLMGIGTTGDGTCAACATARKEANWARVEQMWAEGLTLRHIADAMGWTIGHLAVQVSRMRAAGRAVPYRNRTYAGRSLQDEAS